MRLGIQVIFAAGACALSAVTVRAQCWVAFGPPGLYAAGYDPRAVGLADFNGDGHLDVIVGNEGVTTSLLTVLLNSGAGVLSQAGAFTIESEPTSIVSADFDQDGPADFAVAQPKIDRVSIYRGMGNGQFHAPQQLWVTWPTPQPEQLIVADMNNDQRPDLVAVCPWNSRVAVLLNGGQGPVLPQVEIATPQVPRQGAVGDFNADGSMDIAVVTQGQFALPTVMVYHGNGDGTVQPGVQISSLRSLALCAADINGDGRCDLMVGEGDGSWVWPFLSTPAGMQGQGRLRTINPPRHLIAADMDLDGDLDVVSMSLPSSMIDVLRGHGDGTFDTGLAWAGGVGYAWDVALGDMNGDGRLDVVRATGTLTSGGPASGCVGVHLNDPGSDAPPTILVQPEPVVVYTGADARVSVTIENGWMYQWRRNGVPLTDGGPYAYTRMRELRMWNIPASEDGAVLDCVVGNSCGEVVSEAVVLTVMRCAEPDFDNNGQIGNDADIEAFFRCLAGDCCHGCFGVDINLDGDFGTDADIEMFFHVLNGGTC